MSIPTRSTYFILLIAPILAVFLLYYFSLNYFFFQDDFFHINIAKAENIQDIINFFKFRNDIIGYRPISIQSYFFLLYSIFGLKPLYFRVFNFLIFVTCYLLINKISTIFSGKKSIGLVAATLWALSSFHFMTLVWISASYQLIGTLFYLLSFLLLIKSTLGKNSLYYFISLIAFLLSLGSFEFSVTLPILFLLYCLIWEKDLLDSIKLMIPFILIIVIYLILRFLLKETPRIEDYAIKIGVDSIKAYFWYLLWSLNVPEEFKYQVTKLVILNSTFLSIFWKLAIKSYVGLLAFLLLGIALPLIKFIKHHIRFNWRIITFSLLWFSIGISPVLIFPKHTYLMYLTLPSISIYLLIAYFLVNSKSLWLTIALFGVWLFTSVTAIDFYKSYSYMIEAQDISRRFMIEIKSKFPALPSGSVILYPLINPAHIQALSNQNAIKVIYNDPTLEIYYNKDQLMAESKNFGERKVFVFPPDEIKLEKIN